MASFCSFSTTGSEVNELLDKMTLGVAKTLEKKPGVTDIHLLDKNPAEKSAIYSWEQKNMCFLPVDLKDFYFTTDGILIEWSILFDGGNLPLGKMEVNSIGKLTPLHGDSSALSGKDKPSLFDIDDISDDEDSQGNKKPKFNESCKSFELDGCGGFSKVCLVYKDIKRSGVTDSTPEIWLLDRSLRWSYLASSFQSYFRMLIVHLGLPLWQYRFTSAGLSPETKQWFNMYAPSRLMDGQGTYSDVENNQNEEAHNLLDVIRVFKGKHDSSRNPQKQGKKKAASNSKTNLSSRFGLGGFKAQQK